LLYVAELTVVAAQPGSPIAVVGADAGGQVALRDDERVAQQRVFGPAGTRTVLEVAIDDLVRGERPRHELGSSHAQSKGKTDDQIPPGFHVHSSWPEV
jgi:hypothetical protein